MPQECLLLFRQRIKFLIHFFHLIAARSLDIQLSRGGKEFWLLFWVGTLSSSYLLHRKPLTLLSEERKRPSRALICCSFACGQNFFAIAILWSGNTLFCPSLLWVSLVALGCCVYSLPVKLMLPFLTPTILTLMQHFICK